LDRFDRLFWKGLWSLTRPYWVAEKRARALGLLAIVVVLSLGMIGMRAVFSYVSRDEPPLRAAKTLIAASLKILDQGTPQFLYVFYDRFDQKVDPLFSSGQRLYPHNTGRRIRAKFLFQVPFLGSLWVLSLGSLLYLLVALGIGMLISSTVKAQFVASLIVVVAAFIPALMLSGFLFELNNLPVAVRFLSYLFPARYFVALLQTVLLAGDVAHHPAEYGGASRHGHSAVCSDPNRIQEAAGLT
jgi:ABC-type uncharacterized transport system fused permease/ATPase subunit